ncbi:MAG TPA: DUF3943 domain-containing protein [Polyangiaceae bacterium]|jgi:hypothetical protein|nr:DUF3943 domain-containing protein [Polyangiaceae bacterium]
MPTHAAHVLHCALDVHHALRSSPWLLVALTLLTWCIDARAESSDSVPDTFEYTTPTEKNYLRAVFELGALTTVGVAWYAVDVRQGKDVGYRWQMFQKKLSGSAFGHDDNAFGTNFRGHGLGGNVYYGSARSNHLGIGESFGFAVAGAVLWEYFGEINEVVSVNDLIVTPFTGIGLGEPLTQFSAFFDRQSPTALNRVLGTVFGPLKSVNDALDGAKLSRSSTRRKDWHRFSAAAGLSLSRTEFRRPALSVRDHTDYHLEVSERLARLPDYDAAGRHAQWFSDANVSGMSLNVAFGVDGLRDFAFGADFVPVGYYQRSAWGSGDELHGSGWLLGFQMGYRYLVHDFAMVPQTGHDRTAFVQPVGALFEANAELGSVSIGSRLSVAGIYGGVHPLASEAYGPDRSALPSVVQHFDYYFGAGGQLESTLDVRVFRLDSELSLLGRSFVCVDEHAQLPMSDAWRKLRWTVGYRIHPSWSLRVRSEDLVRTGRLGVARASAHETSAGFEVRAIF